MNRNTVSGGASPRRSKRPTASRLPAIGLAAGTAVLAAGAMAPPTAAAVIGRLKQNPIAQRQLESSELIVELIVQDDGGQGPADQVQTKQVDQYVAVYKAMQKNHSLTVSEACARQGITVAQFREIENKIERDDQLRAIVRKALNPAGAPASVDDDN